MPALEAAGSPPSTTVKVTSLPPLKPDLYERAWCSVPHPTLPLLATAHGKAVTVFSLTSLTSHSTLTGGHTRSVRSVSWKPNLPPHQLCLVTGSFDSTAGLWRWDGELPFSPPEEDPTSATASAAAAAAGEPEPEPKLETEVTVNRRRARADSAASSSSDAGDKDDWEFTLVLEGHDSEIKSALFSPSGAHLATCSRDQTVWVWEDVGATEGDDEWETVAVLNEHDADMKALAWCPDVPGRNSRRGVYSSDVLASTSYDNTVRIWREDGDGEWVCVAVLEGHEGTVWGASWEGKPREDGKFPRLATFSADKTIRIWSLRQNEKETQGEEGAPAAGGGGGGGGAGDPAGGGFGGALGGIPNTMRQSLREDWYCSDVLPAAHTRDVYAAAWSHKTGLVASTGSDGTIIVYEEQTTESAVNGATGAVSEPGNPSRWQIVAKVVNAHGPYEVNHVTWCRRFDSGAEKRGEDEMLITTGDEGVVRPWEVTVG